MCAKVRALNSKKNTNSRVEKLCFNMQTSYIRINEYSSCQNEDPFQGCV